MTFTRVGELKPKPIDWLVRGLIPADALGALIGAPDTYKSFLALDLALCIATGRPFLGATTGRGAVLYLAGEGQQGLERRVDAWRLENDTRTIDPPLFVSSGLPPLTDLASLHQLINAIDDLAEQVFYKNLEPKLIVIDTLARAMGDRNENLAQDMGELIVAVDILRGRYSATVLLVHHSGHESGGRARGSSALPAAMDFSFSVSRLKGNRISVKPTKAKDWELSSPFELIAQQVHLPSLDGETSLVLQRVSDEAKRADVVALAIEMDTNGVPVAEILAATGLPKSTFYRLRSAKKPPSRPSG